MFFFRREDINAAVAACRAEKGALLLDVREREEYAAGHIPGALNLPLSRIREADFPGSTALYVCCLRGSRSKQAVAALRQMGYEKAKSIGGILRYKGELER